MSEPRAALATADPSVAGLPTGLGASDLPSQISGILEEAIISGVLEPGQRLRAEALATHYGVSRIPVREALRSLEAAGWVRIKPRYGVYVAERSEEELTALFDVRAVLEAHVARRAAERRTPEDLDELGRSVDLSRDAARRQDGAALTGLSTQFYSALGRAAHNSVLQATVASLQKRARFYFATVAKDLGRDWVHTHEELLDAVRRQDGDAAARISQHHIEETGHAVQKLLAAQ